MNHTSAYPLLLIATAFAQPASAVSFTGLGFLPGGGSTAESYSYGADVSADGSVVVGSGTNADGQDEAFRWTPSTGMQGLGILGANPAGMSRSYANGVSADGTVITGGSSSPTVTVQSLYGGTVAFRWTEASGMVDLGLFPGGGGGGGGRTTGSDISRDGTTIVGASWETAGVWRDGSWLDIGDLPGGSLDGFAWATSADGSVVVGNGYNADDAQEGFRWTASTGLVGLGIPAGAARSDAYGVSADGLIVLGAYGLNGANKHAAYWAESTGWVSLGTIGLNNELANAITDDRSMIVGSASTYDFNTGNFIQDGFIWDPVHGMRTANAVLSGDYGLDLTGWHITNIATITADGRFLVGAGINPNGLQEAWVADLKPVPIPGAVWMFGSALAGFAGFARRR